MQIREKSIPNLINSLEQIYFLAGIPKSFYNLKYSSIIKSLSQVSCDKIKKFLNKKIQGIFFIADDYTIPYVVFRRMLLLNNWIFGKSKIVDACEIQNKHHFYASEKLYGIFRIDPNIYYNKYLLFECIVKAYKNNAQIMMTTNEKNKEKLATYFEPICDIFEGNDFEVVRLNG